MEYFFNEFNSLTLIGTKTRESHRFKIHLLRDQGITYDESNPD